MVFVKKKKNTNQPRPLCSLSFNITTTGKQIPSPTDLDLIHQNWPILTSNLVPKKKGRILNTSSLHLLKPKALAYLSDINWLYQ